MLNRPIIQQYTKRTQYILKDCLLWTVINANIAVIEFAKASAGVEKNGSDTYYQYFTLFLINSK